MEKKDVCLITYHRAYNYGAVLQAYATIIVLNSYNFNTKIIDYTPEYLQGYGTLKNTFYQADNKNKNLIKRIIHTIIKTPSYKKMKKPFCKFVLNNMVLTEKYDSYEALKENIPKADYYCSGSDQVWNNYYTEKFDDAFFLNFLNKDQKCFSFASSFGKSEFSEEEEKYIKNSLSKFSFITVRETEGKKIVDNLNLKNTGILFDPTILIDFKKWNSLARDIDLKEPYILIYQLHGDTDVYKKAIEFGKKKKKKVVRIITMYHQIKPGCKNIILPEVEEFLGLFKNAEYVFTDSFHGTIFSLIFKKRLGIVIPHKFGNRITSLLSMIESNECILKDNTEWEQNVTQEYIEYSHEKLLKERTNNLKQLEEKLKKLDNK